MYRFGLFWIIGIETILYFPHQAYMNSSPSSEGSDPKSNTL
jgi:hypothetical protein